MSTGGLFGQKSISRVLRAYLIVCDCWPEQNPKPGPFQQPHLVGGNDPQLGVTSPHQERWSMSEDVLVFTTAGATGICGWSQGCCSTLHNAQHRPPQQGMVQPQGQQGRLWGHVSGEGPLADSAQEFPHISRLQRTAPPSVQDSQLRARRCTWSRCQADIRNKAAVALGGSSYGESHRPRAAPLLSVRATETDAGGGGITCPAPRWDEQQPLGPAGNCPRTDAASGPQAIQEPPDRQTGP